MKHKPIKTGNDLMNTAISALEDYRGGRMGSNMALYPVIIVFLGNKAKEHLMDVKQPLDDNWANAPRLQFVAAEIEGGEAYGTVLQRDESDYTEVFWNSERTGISQALKVALFAMLDIENNVFGDKNKFKIDFILDATEDDAEALYKLYKEYDNGKFGPQKSLYLMLNQGPDEEDEVKSDKILHTILADKPEGIDDRNIFLISNLQKDNTLVSKIAINYRLVADIIILGGNNNRGTDDEVNVGNRVLQRGIKTAAFHIEDRPNAEIGEVAVDAVLREIYSEEEKHAAVESGDRLFCERFGVSTGTGEITESQKLYDRAYEIVADRINPAAVRYFPYRDVNVAETLGKKPVRVEDIDAASFGTCSAYIQKNIAEPLRKYFEEEERKAEYIKQLSDQIVETFTYFELLSIKKEIDIVKSSIFSKVSDSPVGTEDICMMFFNILKNAIKQEFYAYYKNMLWEALAGVMKQVDSFSVNYQKICDEMASARSATGEEEENLENFYKGRVSEYIRSSVKRAENGKAVFGKVFDVRLDKMGILEAIFNEYLAYVDSDSIFKADFEGELNLRSSKMDEAAKIKYIDDRFNTLMEGSMRLNNSPNKNFKIEGSLKFYLVNGNAAYAGTLKKLRKEKDGDYHLFSLNRTDCIEKLEIYTIKDTNEIHLINPNK